MNIAEQLRTIADNVPKVYQAGYDDGAAAGGGGANPSEIVENLPIALDFSDGDQEIVAPDGVLVKSAIIQKPETLNPENIAEGVNIAGIVGTLAAGGGTSDELCYVTFMSYDGSVEYGKKAVAVGDDCADPIARGIFNTPTRESDAQYNYTFYGWATEVNGAADSNWNKSITEDKTVYANFASAVRYYTITYYDSDGTTVLKTESLAYGSVPNYAPEKQDFAFLGWIPEPAAVVGNTSYTATWDSVITFNNASWSQIEEIVASGKAQDVFSLGDTKILVLTQTDGTTLNVPVAIAAFEHDDLANGSGKAGVTIICNEVITTLSVGTTPNDYMWSKLPLRTSLNSGDIYAMLPDELKAVIKPVTKTTTRGRKVSGNFTTGSLETTSDSVWVLSAAEVGLSGHGGTEEGTEPYPIFTDDVSRKRKKLAATTFCRWTLRTGYPRYTATSCQVSTSGTLEYGSFDDSMIKKYLVFGFCI